MKYKIIFLNIRLIPFDEFELEGTIWRIHGVDVVIQFFVIILNPVSLHNLKKSELETNIYPFFITFFKLNYTTVGN